MQTPPPLSPTNAFEGFIVRWTRGGGPSAFMGCWTTELCDGVVAMGGHLESLPSARSFLFHCRHSGVWRFEPQGLQGVSPFGENCPRTPNTPPGSLFCGAGFGVDRVGHGVWNMPTP